MGFDVVNDMPTEGALADYETVHDWCTGSVNGVNVNNSVNMILTEIYCSWNNTW